MTQYERWQTRAALARPTMKRAPNQAEVLRVARDRRLEARVSSTEAIYEGFRVRQAMRYVGLQGYYAYSPQKTIGLAVKPGA